MKLPALCFLSVAALGLGPSSAIIVHNHRHDQGGRWHLLDSSSSDPESAQDRAHDGDQTPSPEVLKELRKMMRELEEKIVGEHEATQKRLDRLREAFDKCPKSPAAVFRQENMSEDLGEYLCVRHERCYDKALSELVEVNASFNAGQANRTAEWRKLQHMQCLAIRKHGGSLDEIDNCNDLNTSTVHLPLALPAIPQKNACAEGVSAADKFLSSLHAKRHPVVVDHTPLLPTNAHKQLLVLMRTGGSWSKTRFQNVMRTWGQDLEPGSLVLLERNLDCKMKFGENHGRGLTCLEAKADLKLMNRTDYDWLLVVDDDAYVFVDRVRAMLKSLSPTKREVYGVTNCGNCGHGRKGLCGGGGFLLSRRSLLSMANAKAAPVPHAIQDSFLTRFVSPPTENYSDVRFGCMAQDAGLRLVHVRGMYSWHEEFSKERGIVALLQGDPPLVMHYIVGEWHFQRLRREHLKVMQSSSSPYSFEGWKVR